MVAFGTDAWALGVSAVALVVSGCAVFIAKQQTPAIRGANAPTVRGDLTGAENHESGPCLVTLTFEGKAEITVATITVRSRSTVEHISEPGSGFITALSQGSDGSPTADRTQIQIRDVAYDSPIMLSAQATDFEHGKLRVDAWGPAFGNARINVDLKNLTRYSI